MNLIAEGQYSHSGFVGFYISDTQRMSYDYILYELNSKTGIWETIANKSNPFKFISTEPVDNLVTYVNKLVDGLEEYSMQIEGFKHTITKSIHEASWIVKSNWYPRGMFITLWTVCEELLDKKTDASLEYYEENIIKTCEYTKDNIIILKYIAKSVDNNKTVIE